MRWLFSLTGDSISNIELTFLLPSAVSVVCSRLSDEKQFVFMKGAVERIIDACTQVQTAEGLVPLNAEMERTILANVEALAAQGLRVLGLAQKSWTAIGQDSIRADVEEGMVLQGLVGLYGESNCSALR